MSASKFSGESSEEIVSRVTDEVDRLLQRHRVELNRCLEHWAQNVREPVEPGRLAVAMDDDPCSARSFAGDLMPQLACELGEVEVETKVQIAHEQDVREEEQAIAKANCQARGPDASSPGAASAAEEESRPEPTSESRSDSKGLASLKDRAMDFLSAEINKRRPHGSTSLFAKSRSGEPALHRITSSNCFDVFSVTLICLNAIFIGVQTQYLGKRAIEAAAAGRPLERQEPTAFLVLQVSFTALFIIELVPRWAVDGLIGFFLVEDRWWNLMDAGVVMLGLADLLVTAIFGNSDVLGNFSVIRVVRVVRIVRVIRVIRVMSFFRELRMMIFSILRSAKAMVWVILVLSLSFYIFGIIFTVGTYTTLDRIEDWSSEHTEDLRNYFATLDRSFMSLFMSMTDWVRFFEALTLLAYPYRVLFLLYVSFTMFALINIVTGVFVDSALQSNNEDKIITAHEELEAKKEYLEEMRNTFEEMNDGGSGTVTLEQFEAKLGDERVVAYFHAMGLCISDARKLFMLLDGDHSNSIDINEFVDGCYALQGQSRALDMKIMECQVQSLHNRFTTFATTLRRVEQIVADLPHVVAF